MAFGVALSGVLVAGPWPDEGVRQCRGGVAGEPEVPSEARG